MKAILKPHPATMSGKPWYGKSRHLTVTVPLLILAILTAWIRMADIDLRVARMFRSGGAWTLQDHPVILAICNFGVMPAILIALASISILIAGIGCESLLRFRKAAAYLAAVFILGNGIITNLVLKDAWGRPRPCQISEFGGEFRFEPVAWIDLASNGKSFPSGHAAMGFYFFALALAIPARFPRARTATLIFAVALGCAIGFARIAQGAHFLSDILWSAATMWFISLGLVNLMRPAPARTTCPCGKDFRTHRPWITRTAVLALFAPLCLLTFGKPYRREGQIFMQRQNTEQTRVINLDVEGEIRILSGDVLRIESHDNGFGMAKSKIRYRTSLDGGQLNVRSSRLGFFASMDSTVTVMLPAHPKIVIHTKRANAEFGRRQEIDTAMTRVFPTAGQTAAAWLGGSGKTKQ